MTKTMTAITSSRWINPPPTWPRKPRSQRMRRITNMVHSINFIPVNFLGKLCECSFLRLMFYRSSISFRSSSLDLPSLVWSRPRSSSSLPSANVRSLSVNWPYFCFSLPFTSFQPPLNCSLFIAINSQTELKSDASRASGKLKEYYARKTGHRFSEVYWQ